MRNSWLERSKKIELNWVWLGKIEINWKRKISNYRRKSIVSMKWCLSFQHLRKQVVKRIRLRMTRQSRNGNPASPSTKSTSFLIHLIFPSFLGSIEREQQHAQNLETQVEGHQQGADEVEDKFRNKNKIFTDCKCKKKELWEKIREVNQGIQELEDLKIREIQKVLSKILVPQNSRDFAPQLASKQKELDSQKSKLQTQKEKVLECEGRLKEATKELDLIGNEVIDTNTLQRVKDKLDKLRLDLDF